MGMTVHPSRAGVEVCRVGKDILTKGQAKSLAKTLQRRRGRKIGGNLQAYECRACGGWHVGSRRT